MPGALGSRLTGLAVMWAALLGFVLVELQPLWTLLYSRWHAEYVGEQWEYSSAPIPRVLHQTWKTHEPPAELQGYIESWRHHNPHLEHMMWNDTEGMALIRNHYPWFYKHIGAFKTGVEKADIMRYFILYHYGGIYADLDMESVRPIEPLLERHDRHWGVALASEPFDHAQNQDSRNLLVCNAMMISQPRHPFWEAVFKALLEKVPQLRHNTEDLSPVDTTGPVLLTRVFEKHPEAYMDVMVYPSNVFYPLKDGDSKYKPIDPQRLRYAGSFAAHRWHHLWFGRHKDRHVRPWDRKVDDTPRDRGQQDWGSEGPHHMGHMGGWGPMGMRGHHGMHDGWGNQGWDDQQRNEPGGGNWQNGGVWQPAEPNGNGRFNAVKAKLAVARPVVGEGIVGTKLMFFAQLVVPEPDYAKHSVFSLAVVGGNATDVVVNVAANYKLPKAPPPPPDDDEAAAPPPAPPPPPTPEEAALALISSRIPPSARLHVAAVTRHAKNAPPQFRGVGGSDFAPLKRGRVELGGSTTGSASFAIEFEGDMLPADPIVLATPRFPSTEGFAHPKMMDCFAAELTDVRSDGFAVNVARKTRDSCCHLGCILTLCILPKRQQESCGQGWTSSTTRAGG